MTTDHQIEFSQHIWKGENLLWTGRPKQGIVVSRYDILLIPVSILWLLASIRWGMTTYDSNGSVLFFIPVGIGLFFVFGRFLLDAKIREHTYYAMTDRRIIIKHGIYAEKIQSVSIRPLESLSFTERADGTGTIWMSYYLWQRSYSRKRMNESPIEIRLIANVKEVYDLIVEIRDTPRS
jgi:hypothetical protein